MQQFDPAHLSPLPRQVHLCALPYGLTWQEVSPALADFDVNLSAQAQAFLAHQKQGLNGGDNSHILTLRYPARSAGLIAMRSQTIFVKHSTDPLRAEAAKYHFLAAQAVPVPRLLAALIKGDTEIILLEFLNEIGIDFHSPEEVNGLLDLVARLNAVQNPPALFDPRPGLPQAEFDESVRAALRVLADRQMLTASEAARWFAAYLAAQEAAKSMPTALNHNELYFQQVGWAQSENRRELVLFDLETMMNCPRFADIANILFPLAAASGRTQKDLLETYLERLSHHHGPHLRFDQAMPELRLLRVRESCYSLPWLSAASDEGLANRTEHLSITLTCLRQDLTALNL